MVVQNAGGARPDLRCPEVRSDQAPLIARAPCFEADALPRRGTSWSGPRMDGAAARAPAAWPMPAASPQDGVAALRAEGSAAGVEAQRDLAADMREPEPHGVRVVVVAGLAGLDQMGHQHPRGGAVLYWFPEVPQAM